VQVVGKEGVPILIESSRDESRKHHLQTMSTTHL